MKTEKITSLNCIIVSLHSRIDLFEIEILFPEFTFQYAKIDLEFRPV
jgi:hypothetical protein